MLEKPIEAATRKYAIKNGWLTYKFKSPSQKGVPDRIFIKDGQNVYVEFKATGKKPTELQSRVHQQMREYGALVFVIDSIESGIALLESF